MNLSRRIQHRHTSDRHKIKLAGGKVQNFECHWCRFKFKKQVDVNVGNNEYGQKAKHKGCMSTQVRCPRCLRFIPAWETK